LFLGGKERYFTSDYPPDGTRVRIPRPAGMIHFYNPALVNIDGYSTFMCQGTEPDHPPLFKWERIPKNGVELGIVTSLRLLRSHDR
jgi:hypothetical protein